MELNKGRKGFELESRFSFATENRKSERTMGGPLNIFSSEPKPRYARYNQMTLPWSCQMSHNNVNIKSGLQPFEATSRSALLVRTWKAFLF